MAKIFEKKKIIARGEKPKKKTIKKDAKTH